MSAEVIDGAALAARIKADIRKKAEAFFEKTGRKIKLAVVIAGENPASLIYVRNKKRACEEVFFDSLEVRLPAEVSQKEMESAVLALVSDRGVDGILVQLPLPSGLDERKILSLIPPEKDVDGFSAENMGKLMRGEPVLTACTPAGVMRMLEEAGVSLEGKNAVVLGRSNIVGKPVALLLLNAGATVTICNSKTKRLPKICRSADILVAAVGRPRLVTADMIKPGAAVIDVGINRVDGKLTGDVDFAAVAEVAGWITPVPGGVGPMTVAMLLCNTYRAAERRYCE